MEDSLNLYINFLLYAIVGRMAEADSLLRKYKQKIYDAADHSLRGLNPNFLAYRGILLHPSSVEQYGNKIMSHEKLTFISFSEDKDVAHWFADPKSVMSSYVSTMDPGVRGYTIEAMFRTGDFLFVASAQPTLCKLLALAADMHPFIEPSQLRWNLATQKEVIVKPNYDHFLVKLYESSPEETKRLDAKLTHPAFRPL